mgnify:FL=1|jgi:hypothetical protein
MDEFQQENNGRVVEISKKRFFITISVLILIVIAAWFGFNSIVGSTMGIDSAAPQSMDVMSNSDSIIFNPFPSNNRQDSLEDTREFMKTSYNGAIQTRDVSAVVIKVQETVRALDGRVDSINSSEKSGYISFVIPKSDLFEFKYRIEQLTHKKLYVENISSTNLLNQKQGIENRTLTAEERLAELEQEKEDLNIAHTARINSLQNQIASAEENLSSFQMLLSNIDPEFVSEKEIIQSQIDSTIQTLSNLRQAKTNENNSYNSQSNSLLTQIENAEENIDNLIEEDDDFTENIETVAGTVNVRWVSLWKMAEEFSPIPMSINAIILLLIVWKILQKIKFIPRFRFV